MANQKIPPKQSTLYSVIVADPPWRYSFSRSKTRKIENHYSTMALDGIKKLPIKQVSNKNCVLYLWATAPKLLEALEVMYSWGFTYKTQAIWDKEIIGMGYWFRGQHEIILVGTKGKKSPPPANFRISSVISSRRGRHSKKPDYFYNYLSKAFPNDNKLELFARNSRAGWDVLGDEVNDGKLLEDILI